MAPRVTPRGKAGRRGFKSHSSESATFALSSLGALTRRSNSNRKASVASRRCRRRLPSECGRERSALHPTVLARGVPGAWLCPTASRLHSTRTHRPLRAKKAGEENPALATWPIRALATAGRGGGTRTLSFEF